MVYNLRRRNARKNLGGGLSVGHEVSDVVQSLPTAQKSRIEELRKLVRIEQEKPRIEAPASPVAYRSDTGQPITKERWEKRQEEKRKAKEKGFEIDDYSQ